MLKKLRSKRGFTLVEIMVAFVIFAIMAAMVSVILQSTMRAKQENTDLEGEIAGQENVYYQRQQVKDGAYDSSDNHSLVMQFKGTDGSSYADIPLDYSLGDPNAPGAGNNISLEYIQANLDYTPRDTTNPGGDKNSDSNGSVHNRIDSRIFGSSDLKKVILYMTKAETQPSVGYRYYLAIKLEADATMPDIYKTFAQVKLKFNKNTILACGKKNTMYTPSNTQNPISFNDGSKSGYEVRIMSGDTLRIASTNHNVNAQYSLLEPGANYFGVYFDLKEEIPTSYETSDGTYDLNQLFGYSVDYTGSQTNLSDTLNVYEFVPYFGKLYDANGDPLKNDDGSFKTGTYPNIYAGFEKK